MVGGMRTHSRPRYYLTLQTPKALCALRLHRVTHTHAHHCTLTPSHPLLSIHTLSHTPNCAHHTVRSPRSTRYPHTCTSHALSFIHHPTPIFPLHTHTHTRWHTNSKLHTLYTLQFPPRPRSPAGSHRILPHSHLPSPPPPIFQRAGSLLDDSDFITA